jgi:DNA-binding transcriptional LysR family regulator
MEIKWIQDFLSLAQTRSFSRSAEERHVTQSALSRRIRALEAWLGAELVDRSTHPARLTDAGQMFQAQAEQLVRQLFDTRTLLRSRQERRNSAFTSNPG